MGQEIKLYILNVLLRHGDVMRFCVAKRSPLFDYEIEFHHTVQEGKVKTTLELLRRFLEPFGFALAGGSSTIYAWYPGRSVRDAFSHDDHLRCSVERH